MSPASAVPRPAKVESSSARAAVKRVRVVPASLCSSQLLRRSSTRAAKDWVLASVVK